MGLAQSFLIGAVGSLPALTAEINQRLEQLRKFVNTQENRLNRTANYFQETSWSLQFNGSDDDLINSSSPAGYARSIKINGASPNYVMFIQPPALTPSKLIVNESMQLNIGYRIPEAAATGSFVPRLRGFRPNYGTFTSDTLLFTLPSDEVTLATADDNNTRRLLNFTIPAGNLAFLYANPGAYLILDFTSWTLTGDVAYIISVDATLRVRMNTP